MVRIKPVKVRGIKQNRKKPIRAKGYKMRPGPAQKTKIKGPKVKGVKVKPKCRL